jgi:flagellar assembly protein FliH
LGRVLKGAKVAEQRYHIGPPSSPAPRPEFNAPFDDDPIFSEMRTPAFSEPAAAAPQVDLDAARAEAVRLIDTASADAEALLRDAQARALSLIDEANRRVADLEAAAKREGFEQGVSDGRAAAQAEMDQMLETMRGLIEMARIERHKIIEGAEPEIVRLSVTIAERILTQHVALEPNTVLEMTRSAIARLVSRETVTVRVNPADLEVMREHREQLMAMNDIDNLRIIEDQRVDRGGVLLETDAGTIDAKVSTQLREVRRLLAVDDALAVNPSSEPALINPPAQAS